MVKLEKLATLEKRSSVDIRCCEIIADATDERRNERARILRDGERYFFHRMRGGEVVECFEIAVDWKPWNSVIIFAYTPDDRHIYQIDSRFPLDVPKVLRMDREVPHLGDTCVYSGHTVELSTDSIFFDGRKIKVEEDGEYTYAMRKTKILAKGGARGLFAFLDQIAEESKAGERFPVFSSTYQMLAEKYLQA